MSKIKVLVNGAAGKMGRETVKAVGAETDLELVSAIDINNVGSDSGLIAGINANNIKIQKDLSLAIKESSPQIIVDFTHPSSVMENIRTILNKKVNAVVGTTGITEENLKEIENLAKINNVSAIVCPNFATGAILMMKYAQDASKYLPQAEIIELHHHKKADAPSGTAIKTAQMIVKEKGQPPFSAGEEKEIIKGARGGELEGIHIHSIRLPGLMAHQEVIFGGLGQTLSIRHDTISRECYMPGVILAIRKSLTNKGLIYGLENLL